ncbi:GntR family transcriptional regulator [Nonomuraea sp. NPDC005650]|uniref:FadR/GntR family transcriptional regulator n=1 Tax=Nonomuraea sp. NPDC005650 TaxID=3157045 RepID=UPI0033A8D234
MSGLTPLISPAFSGGHADEVVQRIGEAIHLGLLSDGERLPAELELASQFNVAPMTVREALSTLRAQGLVETRRGRNGGSFVCRPLAPRFEMSQQRLVAMTLSDVRDLVDEHQAIAGQSARLAAERASAVNIRRLFGFTEQLRTAAHEGD